MIRSMTGFGRASIRIENVAYDVEVRSVNHRYLDARVRLPRLFAALENDLRESVARVLARGKVDVSVVVPEGDAPKPVLEIDLDVARDYAAAAETLRSSEGVSGLLDVATLLTLPGVARFEDPTLPSEAVQSALRDAVDEALRATDDMRATEGAALERELLERIDTVSGLAEFLAERADAVQSAVRERLRKRAAQLAQETGLVDDARLHQEIVIAADRMDVTEEIVRLRSHVVQFREIVASAGPGKPVGRRLDFLMQEIGREVNTIGSKGGDAPIAHQVVELKTQLERIREQVQNVE